MKVSSVAALALTLAALTSASKPSFRGYQQVGEENVFVTDAVGASEDVDPEKMSNVWDITRSFRVDWTAPNFIRAGRELFDFGPDDVTVVPSNDQQTSDRIYKTSNKGSKLTSFNFGLHGSGMGFSAAASMSTNNMDKSNKKYVRIDHNIDVLESTVTMEPLFPHQYLHNDTKDFLLTQSPEDIYETIGPYYASQFNLGATFELRVVGEVANEEQANDFVGDFKAHYFTFVQASIGGSKNESSSSSCTRYTTSYTTSGGDGTIWLSMSKTAKEMLDEWQKSLTKDNVRPIRQKLQYVWQLLDHDDMDRAKAEAVKKYILGKWASDAKSATAKESALAPATWNNEKSLVGKDITIKQPARGGGRYKVRSDTKDVCTFVKGYNGDGQGKWGLDQLYCSDNSRCLKWGGNAYAGRIVLPTGVRAITYSDWGMQHHMDVYEGEDKEIDFWNFHHRVKGFEFEVLDGYTCGGTVKCL